MADLTKPLPMCMTIYHRSQRMREIGCKGNFQDLYCQYTASHGGVHSWGEIFAADSLTETQVIAQREAVAKVVTQPPVNGTAAVTDFIEGIENGEYDPYLEAILSAGHNRKRTLRGVRLFPRVLRDR